MFNAGFEIEVVGPSGIKSAPQLKQHLKSLIRRPWANTIKTTYDYSIDDERLSRQYKKDPRECFEVITKPTPINQALEQLDILLSWAQAECITNHSTGLHINLSFNEPQLTKKVNFEKLISLIPQEEILTMFDRNHNEYCQAIDLSKLSIEDLACYQECDNSMLSSLIDELYKGVTNTKKVPYKISMQKATNTYRKMSTAKLGSLIKKLLDSKLNDALVNYTEDNDKSLFVIDRKSNVSSTRNHRYFEFRGQGNTDYQYRTEEIFWCIDTYCKAIQKAVV